MWRNGEKVQPYDRGHSSHNDAEPSARASSSNPVVVTGNPMLNPVILDILFEVCDLSDLRRFRLVCRQWHDLSLSRWRQQAKIYLQTNWHNCIFKDKDQDIVVLPKTRERLTADTLPTLLENESIVRKPYRNYQFDDLALNTYSLNCMFDGCQKPKSRKGGIMTTLYNEATFFRHCGSWIHQLHLRNPEMGRSRISGFGFGEQAFNKLIFELTPNLRVLHITGLRFSGPRVIILRIWPDEDFRGAGFPPEAKTEEEDIELQKKNLNLTSFKLSVATPKPTLSASKIPFRWKQLFQYFPNLQDLKINSTSPYDHSVFDQLFEYMAKVTRGEASLKIKRLQLKTEGRIGPEKLAVLFTSPKLSLESVAFDVADDEENSLLPIVIQRHGPTLKTFEVSNSLLLPVPYASFPFQVTLPNMTKVKLCSTLIDNLDFLDSTPNLRVLSIKEPGDSSTPERGLVKLMTGTNLEKLEGVVLEHLSKFLLPVIPPQENGFKLNHGHIEALVSCMPNVKELNVPVTTEGLRVICRMWTGLRQLCGQDKDLTDEGLTGISGDSGREERLPNITNLKYLEGLFLNTERLSDASIFQGFFQLPNLRRLAVTMSYKTSVEGFRALRLKFRSIRIARIGVQTRHIQNKEDAEMETRIGILYKEYGII